MLYYLLLLVYMLGTTGAAFGAGDELYLSCGGWVKMASNPRVNAGLEIKDGLRAFIDAAICPKDQESVKSTSEPAIVGHGKNCALILIKGMFERFCARQI
jgi:hypothetical protein